MKKYVFLMAFALSIFSCKHRNLLEKQISDNKNEGAVCMEMSLNSDAFAALPPPPMAYFATPEKKIIKNADITIEVANVNQSRSIIDTLLMQTKGYVVRENYLNDIQQDKIELTIKVPAINFTSFLQRLSLIKCTIRDKTVTMQDITAEYVDVQTRLKNKKLLEKRYNEILKSATTVKDILEIEEKTEAVRADIESMESKIKLFDHEVAYSEVSLQVIKPKEHKALNKLVPINFTERLSVSLYKGWDLVVSFFLLILQLWAVWILLVIGIVWFKRYRRNKKIEKAE